MIKNFYQFIKENEDPDFNVSDIFSTLSRNYQTAKSFFTDQTQFGVEEERRDWGDIRSKSVLEKTKTADGFYKLVFRLDERKFLLEIDFTISYMGKKEKDAPETLPDEELSRLNTVLTDLDIKKISLKSANTNYSSSKPSDSVIKSCKDFMLKMLAGDYDTLGEELYNMEQS